MNKELNKLASYLYEAGDYKKFNQIKFIIKKFSQEQTAQMPTFINQQAFTNLLGEGNQYFKGGTYSRRITLTKSDGTTLSNVLFTNVEISPEGLPNEERWRSGWPTHEELVQMGNREINEWLSNVSNGANISNSIITYGNTINGESIINDAYFKQTRVIGTSNITSCHSYTSSIYDSKVFFSDITDVVLDEGSDVTRSKLNSVGISNSKIITSDIYCSDSIQNIPTSVDDMSGKIVNSNIINSKLRNFSNLQNVFVDNSEIGGTTVIYNSTIKNQSSISGGDCKILNADIESSKISGATTIGSYYSGRVWLKDCEVLGGTISGNARLVGFGGSKARLMENGFIYDNAIVSGTISGNAQVYDNAKVFSAVTVTGTAKVFGNAVLQAGTYTSGDYNTGVWDGPQSQLNWRDAIEVTNQITEKMNTPIDEAQMIGQEIEAE